MSFLSFISVRALKVTGFYTEKHTEQEDNYVPLSNVLIKYPVQVNYPFFIGGNVSLHKILISMKMKQYCCLYRVMYR